MIPTKPRVKAAGRFPALSVKPLLSRRGRRVGADGNPPVGRHARRMAAARERDDCHRPLQDAQS
jgi:hypothetical protein